MVALALGATLALAAPAAAAEAPRNQGAASVQAGLSTLKSLGLLQAAASKQLDYSTLANPTTGPSTPPCRRAATCPSARW